MKIQNYIIIGLLVVIAFLAKCQTSTILSLRGERDSLLLANQKLDSTRNKLNQTIYTQTTLRTEDQAAIKALSDSNFLLKNKDKKNRDIIAYFQANSNVVFHTLQDVGWIDEEATQKYKDSLLVAINQQCREEVRSILDTTVFIGTESISTTSTFTIHATVSKKGLTINQLVIPDTLRLQFVEHKGSLFRKKRIEVQFFHSSPYIQTTSSNSVFYTPKKKAHLLTKALILGAGIYLGTKL